MTAIEDALVQIIQSAMMTAIETSRKETVHDFHEADVLYAKNRILSLIQAEIIGDNEIGNIGYDGEDMVDDTSEEMLYRNQLRAEQRNKLTKKERNDE